MPRTQRTRRRPASRPPSESEEDETRVAARAPRRRKGQYSPCDKQYRAGLTK